MKTTKPYEILIRFKDEQIHAHVKDLEKFYDDGVLVYEKELDARPLYLDSEEYQEILSGINTATIKENEDIKKENDSLKAENDSLKAEIDRLLKLI